MDAMASRRDRGFSLVELMVVIVILGILGTTVTIAFFPQIFKAKRQKAIETILTLDHAIQLYAADKHGTLPRALEELTETSEVSRHPYLDADGVPADPWGGQFDYEPPSSPNGEDYDILCLGADGAPGGDGQGEDIRLSDVRNRH